MDDERSQSADNLWMAIRERQKWFLREWRRHRGLSQQKLADRLGTSKGHVSDLETGRLRYNQDHLEALADVLQCGPADLLMRNPLDSEAVWTIWEHIPEAKRDDALNILKALSEPVPARTKPRKSA